MSNNLARQGPHKVWEGYKTMRVPKEIFDDVKSYMEKRKQQYLMEQQGISDENMDDSFKRIETKREFQEAVKAAIREELESMKGTFEDDDLPPSDLSAKEQIEIYLSQHPDQKVTTKRIEEKLDLAASTVRQATRELAEEFDYIKKISGRPNKFIYQSH